MAKKPTGAAAAMAHPMENEGSAHALLARNLPLISRSMTFAKMVKANARAIPNFKDLYWLFPPLCRRKDQAALTDVERSRYICAFNMINSDGTLGQLVDIHSEFRAHLGRRHHVRRVGVAGRSDLLAAPCQPRSALVAVVQQRTRQPPESTVDRLGRRHGSMDLHGSGRAQHCFARIHICLRPPGPGCAQPAPRGGSS